MAGFRIVQYSWRYFAISSAGLLQMGAQALVVASFQKLCNDEMTGFGLSLHLLLPPS